MYTCKIFCVNIVSMIVMLQSIANKLYLLTIATYYPYPIRRQSYHKHCKKHMTTPALSPSHNKMAYSFTNRPRNCLQIIVI